jgi:hypothetical protein
MVNSFTASTVMQSFTQKYRFQTRSYEPDGQNIECAANRI